MKTILTSILIAYILVEIVQLDRVVKKIFRINPDKRVKPFDCITCLSFWVCIGLLFVPSSIVKKMFIVTTTTFIASLVSSYITEKKLK
jgi:hypothetical protein